MSILENENKSSPLHILSIFPEARTAPRVSCPTAIPTPVTTVRDNSSDIRDKIHQIEIISR